MQAKINPLHELDIKGRAPGEVWKSVNAHGADARHYLVLEDRRLACIKSGRIINEPSTSRYYIAPELQRTWFYVGTLELN